MQAKTFTKRNEICYPSIMSTEEQVTSVNVSLPVSIREFVEQQIASGEYSTVSEYFSELVREDKRRKEVLEELLLKGLDSGQPIDVTPEYWEKKKAVLRDKYK